MENNIGPALKSAASLSDIKKELIKLFKLIKNQAGGGIIRIGYVAGIINSDGPEYFEINRKKLANHTEKLRIIHKFPMFSATDVFSDDVYTRLEEMALSFEKREINFRRFWREIFKSGYVTDIFMTPHWDKSKEAQDEHKTAKKVGLTIHYVKD